MNIVFCLSLHLFVFGFFFTYPSPLPFGFGFFLTLIVLPLHFLRKQLTCLAVKTLHLKEVLYLPFNKIHLKVRVASCSRGGILKVCLRE